MSECCCVVGLFNHAAGGTGIGGKANLGTGGIGNYGIKGVLASGAANGTDAVNHHVVAGCSLAAGATHDTGLTLAAGGCFDIPGVRGRYDIGLVAGVTARAIVKGVSLGGTAVRNGGCLVIVSECRDLIGGYGVLAPLTNSRGVAVGGTGSLGHGIGVGVCLLCDDRLIACLTGRAGVNGEARLLTGCLLAAGNAPGVSGGSYLFNSLVIAVCTGVSRSTATGTGCRYGRGGDAMSGSLAGYLLCRVAASLTYLKGIAVSGTGSGNYGFLVGVAVKRASFSRGKSGYGVVGEVVCREYGVSVVVLCLDRLNLALLVDEPYCDGVNVLAVCKSVGNSDGYVAVKAGNGTVCIVKSEVVDGVVSDLVKLIAKLTDNCVKILALKCAGGDLNVTLKTTKGLVVKCDACVLKLDLADVCKGVLVNGGFGFLGCGDRSLGGKTLRAFVGGNVAACGLDHPNVCIGVGVVLIRLVVTTRTGNKLLTGVGTGGVGMYCGLERVALGLFGLVYGLAAALVLAGAGVGKHVGALADKFLVVEYPSLYRVAGCDGVGNREGVAATVLTEVYCGGILLTGKCSTANYGVVVSECSLLGITSGACAYVAGDTGKLLVPCVSKLRALVLDGVAFVTSVKVAYSGLGAVKHAGSVAVRGVSREGVGLLRLPMGHGVGFVTAKVVTGSGHSAISLTGGVVIRKISGKGMCLLRANVGYCVGGVTACRITGCGHGAVSLAGSIAVRRVNGKAVCGLRIGIGYRILGVTALGGTGCRLRSVSKTGCIAVGGIGREVVRDLLGLACFCFLTRTTCAGLGALCYTCSGGGFGPITPCVVAFLGRIVSASGQNECACNKHCNTQKEQ